ncbi:acyl-CoA dehydrogenase family protein [Kitasatospora albolonga]|uniref:acyl-CoA dehydrogenase family protein n=1 Tax=Kitasatospora albolonga TaxID=68173 RepID=UPI0035E6E94B
MTTTAPSGLHARLAPLLPPEQAAPLARLLDGTLLRRPPSAVTDTGAHRRLARLAAHLPPAPEVLADPELLVTVSELTALADPALYQTFLSHYILCVGSLAALGGAEADLGGELAHARTKGSFMVTEIGEASSHLRIRTEARYDAGRRVFLLHTPDEAAAKFSSVAAPGLPQQAVVCARIVTGRGQDGGVFSFLTDITGADGRPAPGVSISGPVTLDALPLPYGFVRFDGAEVPRDRWLADGATIDGRGVVDDPIGGQDARLQRTLSCGQVLWATLPSAMAALAARSAATAWRFSSARRSHGRLAPGRPVLEYRTQQHAVIGALATAHTLRGSARAALAEWAALRDSTPTAPGPGAVMTFSPWAAVDRALALRKVHATRAVAETVDELRHRCGLSGFFGENRLSEYLGLARAFENAGGDNTLTLMDAGRALAEGTALPTELGEDLPAPTGPGWWPAVLAALQDRLAAELARSLAERRGASHEGLDLWNPLLADVLLLGEVHAARLAADAASAGEGGGDVPGAAELATLDGLRRAHRLAGPLLAHGVLAPATVRALPAAMDTVCDRLLPQLPEVVAALDPAPGGAALDAPEYAAAVIERHAPAPVSRLTARIGRTREPRTP